jgi:DNA-binding CsgD family transcriptional regulator
MSQIYQSDHLSIDHLNGILVQEWTKNELTAQSFKEELHSFLECFKKWRPSGVLWLQEHFSFHIPVEMHQWIEKQILEPQYKCGLRKLALTVPKNQLAHLSIIDSFNQVSSVMHPRYFVNRDKALHFLQAGLSGPDRNEFKYEISRSLDKTEILLEVHHRQLPHAIKHLDRLKEQFSFRIKHADCFEQLTLRELEIFKSIVSGSLNRDIAESLYISESTVATHRKSITKKLKIKSSKDWHLFATAFL